MSGVTRFSKPSLANAVMPNTGAEPTTSRLLAQRCNYSATLLHSALFIRRGTPIKRCSAVKPWSKQYFFVQLIKQSVIYNFRLRNKSDSKKF